MNQMNPLMPLPNNSNIPPQMMANNVNIDPMAGMSIYKPRGNGTLITDLIKDNSNDSLEGKKYNRQNNNSSRYNSDTEHDYNRIKDIADDVNNSLRALEKFENNHKKKSVNEYESEEYTEPEDKIDHNDDKITLETVECDHTYLKLIIEFVLLLTLYVILSQPFVVSFASKYIIQLNPSDDGVITMTGIIIYGLILTILFLVLRKLLFMKLSY